MKVFENLRQKKSWEFRDVSIRISVQDLPDVKTKVLKKKYFQNVVGGLKAIPSITEGFG